MRDACVTGPKPIGVDAGSVGGAREEGPNLKTQVIFLFVVLPG